MAEELHELGLVAARLQLVEERSELLVIEFFPSDAPQYPTNIEWIKTANKAEWKYDPDGRPGIWVSLFWFQQGFRPSHETYIAERFPTAGAGL